VIAAIVLMAAVTMVQKAQAGEGEVRGER
jgi:hypothetical protein